MAADGAPGRGGVLHRVHVVEPTLEDYAGHCHGLVRSFCDAATGFDVELWAGRGSASLDFGDVSLHPVFRRRLRVLQLYGLLGRLLQGPDPVVIMTARRGDLVLARLAAGGVIPPGRLFLYFHWFRETGSRVAFLRRIARAQPHIAILATTPSAAEVFSRAGFTNVVLLPYPLTGKHAEEPSGDAPFRHLLYAGAARRDKGFGLVVDLVERLAGQRSAMPVAIQISADHYGKYDNATLADIGRLERIGYPALTMLRATLEPDAYAALFRGAICLQPYDRDAFRDRVSGVTLDALTHGCPVVVPSDTWMARLIRPHAAGIELPSVDVESLEHAVRTLVADYPGYRKRAIAAGIALGRRSWEPLIELLARDG